MLSTAIRSSQHPALRSQIVRAAFSIPATLEPSTYEPTSERVAEVAKMLQGLINRVESDNAAR